MLVSVFTLISAQKVKKKTKHSLNAGINKVWNLCVCVCVFFFFFFFFFFHVARVINEKLLKP